MENGNEPATKADLQQLGGGLRSEMRQLGDQLRSEMQHMYNDVVERISGSETKLLKAFYTFAETNQQRLTQVEGNSRIIEVEKRLNMPPAA